MNDRSKISHDFVRARAGINVTCGEYWFRVQDRRWYSNFTHSLCVDDSTGTTYLIVFNPLEGEYHAEIQNRTAVLAVNFKPFEGGVTLSTARNITATNMRFAVSDSMVLPETSWWVQYQLWIVGIVIGTVLVVAIPIILRRRKRSTRALFQTICSKCQHTRMVPFKPDGKRPVFCRGCYRKIRSEINRFNQRKRGS